MYCTHAHSTGTTRRGDQAARPKRMVHSLPTRQRAHVLDHVRHGGVLRGGLEHLLGAVDLVGEAPQHVEDVGALAARLRKVERRLRQRVVCLAWRGRGGRVSHTLPACHFPNHMLLLHSESTLLTLRSRTTAECSSMTEPSAVLTVAAWVGCGEARARSPGWCQVKALLPGALSWAFQGAPAALPCPGGPSCATTVWPARAR